MLMTIVQYSSVFILCSLICVLVGWFVSGITHTTELLSMKLEWRMDLCPEENPLTFSVGPDKGTDPEFNSLSKSLCDKPLFQNF